MLASSLSFSGFEVETASGAPEALASVARERPDAVVLDVMMPGTDGFEFVQLLRRRDAALPVLFLSARDQVEDRVRGLRMGGDDYLTKPFSTVEVIARIEALLRRAALGQDEPDSSQLAVSDLTMDRDAHLVRRGDRLIELSPTEYRLLELLMVNAGRVLSKTQILEEIWMYDFGGDSNVVERFVSSLRRKIDGDQPTLIRTVRGFGYTMRPPGAP